MNGVWCVAVRHAWLTRAFLPAAAAALDKFGTWKGRQSDPGQTNLISAGCSTPPRSNRPGRTSRDPQRVQQRRKRTRSGPRASQQVRHRPRPAPRAAGRLFWRSSAGRRTKNLPCRAAAWLTGSLINIHSEWSEVIIDFNLLTVCWSETARVEATDHCSCLWLKEQSVIWGNVDEQTKIFKQTTPFKLYYFVYMWRTLPAHQALLLLQLQFLTGIRTLIHFSLTVSLSFIMSHVPFVCSSHQTPKRPIKPRLLIQTAAEDYWHYYLSNAVWINQLVVGLYNMISSLKTPQRSSVFIKGWLKLMIDY